MIRSQTPGAIRQQKKRDLARLKRIERIPTKSDAYRIDDDIKIWFSEMLADKRIEWLEDGYRVLVVTLRLHGHPEKWREEFCCCPETFPEIASRYGIHLTPARCVLGLRACVEAGVLSKLGQKRPVFRKGQNVRKKLPIHYAFTEAFRARLDAIPRKQRYAKSGLNRSKPVNSYPVTNSTFRPNKMSNSRQGIRFVEKIVIQPVGAIEGTIRQLEGDLSNSLRAFSSLMTCRKLGIDAASITEWHEAVQCLTKGLIDLAVQDVVAGAPTARLTIECASAALGRLKALLPPAVETEKLKEASMGTKAPATSLRSTAMECGPPVCDVSGFRSLAPLIPRGRPFAPVADYAQKAAPRLSHAALRALDKKSVAAKSTALFPIVRSRTEFDKDDSANESESPSNTQHADLVVGHTKQAKVIEQQRGNHLPDHYESQHESDA